MISSATRADDASTDRLRQGLELIADRVFTLQPSHVLSKMVSIAQVTLLLVKVLDDSVTGNIADTIGLVVEGHGESFIIESNALELTNGLLCLAPVYVGAGRLKNVGIVRLSRFGSPLHRLDLRGSTARSSVSLRQNEFLWVRTN